MKYSIIFLAFLFFNLASCQNEDSTKVQSIENLSKDLEKNPHNLELLEKREALYTKQGSNELAITDLQHCINLAPDSTKYLIELADLFMKRGNVNNTLSLLEKASRIDPNNTEIWLKVSEIYLLYKKYNDVFKFANKALAIDPYNDKAYFIKGYAFKEAKDTLNAISNYQQCLKNNPDNKDANIELAFIYSALKDNLAITYYNNAIAIDSSEINTYYNLGLFYQNNDLLNEAISTYKIIIKIDPNFPNSYYNIGYIYLELLKVPDMASQYFTKAIEVKKDYKEAFFNRALCFEEVGNVLQAEADYKMALKIDPTYEMAIEALNRVETTINQKL